ncbi:HK97 family phage prohead protease [Tsuneonella sp. HG249]
MNRAYSFLEIKALDADQRIIEGWATKPEPDRVGDIVESKGASFRLPLPLLMDHDHTAAVGDVFDATVSDRGIRFKAKIARVTEPGAIKDLCDSAWSAAKAGLRRAVSIGFRPLDMEPLPSGGMRFRKWDWYELSMVSVPALASATIDQVKAFDRAQLRKATQPRRVIQLTDSDYRAAGLTPPWRQRGVLKL